MNRSDVALGPTLSTLREFSAEMTPTMIGDLIGDFEPIRIAHNSFTAPDPFLLAGEPSVVKDGDEVYHFVAYVPIGDKVYELDGLKSGPIEVGTLPRPISEMEAAGEAWTHVAARGIEARVAMAQQALASHYALMAITPSRRQVIERELQIGEQAEDSVKVRLLEKVCARRSCRCFSSLNYFQPDTIDLAGCTTPFRIGRFANKRRRRCERKCSPQT